VERHAAIVRLWVGSDPTQISPPYVSGLPLHSATVQVKKRSAIMANSFTSLLRNPLSESLVPEDVPRFFALLLPRFFRVSMWIGSALITAASVAYFDFTTLPPFIIEKLPVRFETLWLASLRIHVASALLSFPLCLLLMTRWIQRRPTWHRSIGRFVGGLVLVALVPSGVVLAFDAKGGAVVTAGFLLSAAIVAGCTIGGVAAARRRDLGSHRRAMRHVVGQMSVAVVSRAMIVGFDVAGLDPDLAYVVALWIPVLGAIAVVERSAIERMFSTFKPIQHVGGNHETSPLDARLRIRNVVDSVSRPGR
jgi:uncharacterized membrane protein